MNNHTQQIYDQFGSVSLYIYAQIDSEVKNVVRNVSNNLNSTLTNIH